MAKGSILIAVVLISTYLASASDPNSLQDFCVADETSPVNVNGAACKDPKTVCVNDFLYQGLHIAADTSSSPDGFVATLVNAAALPGLNTMGIAVVRGDFAPGGVNPPHTHPRAAELFVAIQGTFEVGFITSSPENKLFSKIVKVGEVFAVPSGVVHFQRNLTSKNGSSIVFFDSQTPGLVPLAATLLGSNIDTDILAKAFQVDKDMIKLLESKF